MELSAGKCISLQCYSILGEMRKSLSSYDKHSQIKPALKKCYWWVRLNKKDWNWDKELVLDVMRQICIDNVKNFNKPINEAKRKHDQVVTIGRPKNKRRNCGDSISTKTMQRAASTQDPASSQDLGKLDLLLERAKVFTVNMVHDI